MPKFKKKPVTIEAERFNGTFTALQRITRWAHRDLLPGALPIITRSGFCLHVRTPEGVRVATDGDWIIRRAKGEFYPYRPDAFDANYEPLDVTPAATPEHPSRPEDVSGGTNDQRPTPEVKL